MANAIGTYGHCDLELDIQNTLETSVGHEVEVLAVLHYAEVAALDGQSRLRWTELKPSLGWAGEMGKI